ncbi:MAG: GDP-mannose 4,6-dehydratase [Chloroflexota bacterium]
MRIFITGATGFAGSYLVDNLLAEGHEIFALVRSSPLRQHPRLHGIQGDLLDAASMATAVSQAKPDLIYHLAGQAYPGLSWKKPVLTFDVNVNGTVNLLEAARQYGRPRVIVVTSAEIYGYVTMDDLPLTETFHPEPRHPYGISKMAAGQLVKLYWKRYELPVIEARPFNHIGPRQALGFVVPDFASQLAAIKLGQQPSQMMVGNLEAQRDFTDVRDVVQAYQVLAEKGKPGEAYLICSGLPVAIHYLLTTLSELIQRDVEIAYDPARMRPADIPCLFGSHDKIERHTGWRPKIHLRQTLADVLEEWLEKLARVKRDA